MPHCTATVNDDRALELPRDARHLVHPGQVIEIDLPEGNLGISMQPNYGMLASLDEIARRQEGRRHTDGSQTDAIIREGRSGAMYGYDPT